jgi:hypothetical protein
LRARSRRSDTNFLLEGILDADDRVLGQHALVQRLQRLARHDAGAVAARLLLGEVVSRPLPGANLANGELAGGHVHRDAHLVLVARLQD